MPARGLSNRPGTTYDGSRAQHDPDVGTASPVGKRIGAACVNPRIPYRRDIDGLRAVAVVPVILFHAGFRWPSGGFIGVDVFFVISGYLISGIIRSEMESGRFSVAGFYERRIRRILPALFTLLAVTTVAAWLWLFPNDFRDFGESVAATALFSSNVLFWSKVGYFATPADAQPLLHTWSLAVEEQFYIVFPILLLAVHRVAGRRIAVILGLLVAASFGASLWSVAAAPDAAFYLLPSRAWELLAGALLAWGAVPPTKNARLAEALAGVGLLLIVAAMFALTPGTPFPGATALLPCVGTALLLYAGAGHYTAVGRLLSTPPFVFIGLISYSLYLWHWPIFVFFKVYAGAEPDIVTTLALCGLTGVVAYLSWRHVERPGRIAKISRRRLFGATLAASVVFLGGGVAIDLSGGARDRFPAAVVALASYQRSTDYRVGQCFLSSGYADPELFAKEICLRKAADKRNFLLLGDSHAAHLWQALATGLMNANVMQATASGCKPVIDGRGAARCTKIIDYALREFVPSAHLDAVFLSARWLERDIPGVLATIAFVRPNVGEVFVLGPIVEYSWPLPELLAWAKYYDDDTYAARRRRTEQKEIDRTLRAAVEAAGARYVSTYETICPGDDCTTFAAPGIPMQFDYGHLTIPGAALVVQRWKAEHLLP